MKPEVVQTITGVASTSTYAASGAAVFLGLNASAWGIVGVVTATILGFATFTFNVWFKMKYQRSG